MTRNHFLAIAAFIAWGVGAFALALPAALLASKGIDSNTAAQVWVREVGIALLSLGTMSWLFRHQADSPAMRGFLVGNALLQWGLLPIEIAAHLDGVIGNGLGIVPNSVVHVLLGGGFSFHAWRTRT